MVTAAPAIELNSENGKDMAKGKVENANPAKIVTPGSTPLKRKGGPDSDGHESASSASESKADHRKNWAAFQRSMVTSNGKGGRTAKIPPEIAAKLANIRDGGDKLKIMQKSFDEWMASDKSWGRVLARERAIHQQRFNKNRKQVWKTHAQLVEMYGSEEVADAVALEKGLDTRTVRTNPDAPQCVAAKQFLVNVEEGTNTTDETNLESTTELDYEMDRDGARALVSSRLAPFSDGAEMPIGGMEEADQALAAEKAAEKQRLKEEKARLKKEEAERLKNMPSAICKKWMSGLATDLNSCRELAVEVESLSIPTSIKQEYKSIFNNCAEAMVDARDALEKLTFTDDQDADAKMLDKPTNMAKTRVNDFRSHKKQFAKVRKIYEKTDKGNGE